ncbi:MAG: LysM peptidoglycan-binding domain-containing protein [Hyphomicrobiales bacterium]
MSKLKLLTLVGTSTLFGLLSCSSTKKLDQSPDYISKSTEKKDISSIDSLSVDTTFVSDMDTLDYPSDSLVISEDSLNFPDIKRKKGEPIVRNKGLFNDPPMMETLDKLVNDKFYDNDYSQVDDSRYGKYKEGERPTYTDKELETRINELNKQTPIELGYNKEVRKYIDVYARKSPSLTARMLGLGEVYFPAFEQKLDQYDIPLELKYLAIVESALNPVAGSHAGAKGLWQFMYGTGKMYGLNVNSMVDERFDPEKATDAACRHLRDLYKIYNNWSLALAAYNSGPGNVNKAIRRSGGKKNYWAIWPYLPRETRGYVPAFIAVTYVMEYAEEHNIKPVSPGINYDSYDTVTVKDLLAFDQLNEFLGIPKEDLKFLNPQFKRNIIPASKSKPYTIRIPREYVSDFMNNEDSLYNYKTRNGIAREQLAKEIKKVHNRNVHIVRRGETLGHIANKYRCSVSSLKKWNRLRSNMIRPGQKLVVFGRYAPSISSSSKKNTKSSSSRASYHTVSKNETLGGIASKYKISVSQLRAWNNINGNIINIGQKLRVKNNSTASAPTKKSFNIPKNGKKVYHVIKKGENLWQISQKYEKTSVDKIKYLNEITDVKALKPGMKIVIDVI